MSGTIHGTVLGAPFAFPSGQTLKVNSILVPPQPEDGVMLIKPDNLINGPVLALWCTGDGTGHQRGSAFLVAPGVAVTAHHVIQDYEDKEGLLRADAELVAFGQQGGLGLTWIVRSIVTPEAGDVALLMMDLHTALPEDFSLYVFELGARLPRIGERGTVLGIRSNLPDGVNVLDDRSRHLGKLEAATIASSGPIIDLYPLGRPMIDTPCFSLEATALGGMGAGVRRTGSRDRNDLKLGGGRGRLCVDRILAVAKSLVRDRPNLAVRLPWREIQASRRHVSARGGLCTHGRRWPRLCRSTGLTNG